MLRVKSYDLTMRDSIEKQLVEVVRLHGCGVVSHVDTRHRVFIGKFAIHSDSEIVFTGYFLASEGKNPGIAIAQQRAVRQRIEGINETKYIGIDGDDSRGEVSSACSCRGDGVNRGHTK